MDLNISKEGTPKYTVKVEFADGTCRMRVGERINTYSNDRVYIWFNDKNGRSSESIRLDFNPSDIVLDIDHSEMMLDPSKVERYIDADYFDADKPEEMRRLSYLQNLEISKITFTRMTDDYNYKYLV